jgi:hypothetical protein
MSESPHVLTVSGTRAERLETASTTAGAGR